MSSISACLKFCHFSSNQLMMLLAVRSVCHLPLKTCIMSSIFCPFQQVMCRYLLSMQEGSHGKPLVKLPKAITKEAQSLSAQLLRDGRLKQMEVLSLDMMNNSLHALYSLGAVHKEKR